MTDPKQRTSLKAMTEHPWLLPLYQNRNANANQVSGSSGVGVGVGGVEEAKIAPQSEHQHSDKITLVGV